MYRKQILKLMISYFLVISLAENITFIQCSLASPQICLKLALFNSVKLSDLDFVFVFCFCFCFGRGIGLYLVLISVRFCLSFSGFDCLCLSLIICLGSVLVLFALLVLNLFWWFFIRLISFCFNCIFF